MVRAAVPAQVSPVLGGAVQLPVLTRLQWTVEVPPVSRRPDYWDPTIAGPAVDGGKPIGLGGRRGTETKRHSWDGMVP